MRYIQNTTKNKVNVHLHYPDPNGELLFGKPKLVEIVFRPEIIDTVLGQVTNTGVKAVDDAVYEALLADRSFQYAIDPKNAWLTVLDELPDQYKTPTDALIIEKQLTAKLSQQVAELQAQLDAGGSNGQLDEAVNQLTAARTTISGLQTQLDAAKATEETMTTQVNDLQAQIVSLNEQLEAAKAGSKT
jgi:hypothetical protein